MGTKFTPMQTFFLKQISEVEKELSPNYLAQTYYEFVGKRRYAASRDSFGQTSAAYRTCRFLHNKGLINLHHYKTSGGYSYITVSGKYPKNCCVLKDGGETPANKGCMERNHCKR